MPLLRRHFHLTFAHFIHVNERVGRRGVTFSVGVGAKALLLDVFPGFFSNTEIVEAEPFFGGVVENECVIVTRFGIAFMHQNRV